MRCILAVLCVVLLSSCAVLERIDTATLDKIMSKNKRENIEGIAEVAGEQAATIFLNWFEFAMEQARNIEENP